VALVLVALAGTAQAAGMRVEPGKWEFTTTSRMPMLPSPETSVDTQCVTESEVRPETFLSDSDGCELKDAASDASSMRWTIECRHPEGRMTGNASMTSTGASVEGTMTMQVDVGGQSTRFEQTWRGRRLGPCE